MSNEKIIVNGETINLSKCLKKDNRSYYCGKIFLQACNKEYAEFTCVPKGMLIKLTDTPNDNKYYTKGYLDGKYTIPDDLYNLYHMERFKSASLYQVSNYLYFLKGRLTPLERDMFEAPIVPDKVKALYNEIDFDELVLLDTSLSGGYIKVDSNDPYVVTYDNAGRQYISFKKANEKEIEKLFSSQEIKKLYGPKLKEFCGKQLSYISEAKNHKIYIPKEFIHRLGLDPQDCRILYDSEKDVIYLTKKEVYSDISGDLIDPIKESPIELITEESTDMDILKALFNEFAEFKSTTNKIYKEYRELKAENEAIRKALKEQNKTISVNNGEIVFEEMTL